MGELISPPPWSIFFEFRAKTKPRMDEKDGLSRLFSSLDMTRAFVMIRSQPEIYPFFKGSPKRGFFYRFPLKPHSKVYSQNKKHPYIPYASSTIFLNRGCSTPIFCIDNPYFLTLAFGVHFGLLLCVYRKLRLLLQPLKKPWEPVGYYLLIGSSKPFRVCAMHLLKVLRRRSLDSSKI